MGRYRGPQRQARRARPRLQAARTLHAQAHPLDGPRFAPFDSRDRARPRAGRPHRRSCHQERPHRHRLRFLHGQYPRRCRLRRDDRQPQHARHHRHDLRADDAAHHGRQHGPLLRHHRPRHPDTERLHVGLPGDRLRLGGHPPRLSGRHGGGRRRRALPLRGRGIRHALYRQHPQRRARAHAASLRRQP